MRIYLHLFNKNKAAECSRRARTARGSWLNTCELRASIDEFFSRHKNIVARASLVTQSTQPGQPGRYAVYALWIFFILRGLFFSAMLPIWEGYGES